MYVYELSFDITSKVQYVQKRSHGDRSLDVNPGFPTINGNSITASLTVCHLYTSALFTTVSHPDLKANQNGAGE